ncbi:hypothetical protein QQF64_011925 [Cirrhinus molitorella]|uniref:Uncharacterized protein n=1 Tax=Cirrhinus molitorella TaxID=172907 RepID=A0ABR3LV54_9TELE
MHSGLMLSCPLTQPHLSSLNVDKSIATGCGAIKTLLNCSSVPSELQTHPAASQRSFLSEIPSLPVKLWLCSIHLRPSVTLRVSSRQAVPVGCGSARVSE